MKSEKSAKNKCENLLLKQKNLEEFFKQNPCTALGFSGGVDSSYLLYAAVKYGATVKPYFIKTPFQPSFELKDAEKIAKQLNVELCITEYDVLKNKEVVVNSSQRCYHCKKALFCLLCEKALNDGFNVIIDGTNASDDINSRPGTKALNELSVKSPLRECNITKDEIRTLSLEAGLFTWNKPAYACLATRFPTDTAITGDILKKIERAESFMSSIGFFDFRVRITAMKTEKHIAKIQVKTEQFGKVTECREQIIQALKDDFEEIFLDLKNR